MGKRLKIPSRGDTDVTVEQMTDEGLYLLTYYSYT